MLFCIVDILHETNTALIPSESEAKIVHEVFGASTQD
jgi:hypothetical protein